jgi:hypothetical protein
MQNKKPWERKISQGLIFTIKLFMTIIPRITKKPSVHYEHSAKNYSKITNGVRHIYTHP